MDTNMIPKVSVIMPVFNGDKYLAEAIESVFRQTYADWELIIVDDCSTDGTRKILDGVQDPRVKIFHHEKNLGSVASRNGAILESSAEYIAILDADDVAKPKRFFEEVRFLDKNPDCGVVATWVKIIDETGRPTGVVLKDTTPPEKAPIKLLFHNFIANSSTMIRRSALPAEPFHQEAVPVEDVDLWWRMIHTWKFFTLPKILTFYRKHDKGISRIYSVKKEEVMNRLITAELGKFGIHPSPEELKIHRTNYGYGGQDLEKFLEKRREWLAKLMQKNREVKLYPQELFEEVMAEMWLGSCDANARLGLITWKIFRESPLSQKISWRRNFKKLAKFALKCLLSKDKI